MHALTQRATLASILALAGCGGSAAAVDSGATDSGAADSGLRADSAAPDAGAPGCAHPDFTSEIQLARGVVVARDGTMYFTRGGDIGRRLPDGTIEDAWAPIGASILTGLALDAANQTLFAGEPDGDGTGAASIHRIDVVTGDLTVLAHGGFPYGLTIGPDDMLYYGDTAASAVLRLAPDGSSEPVEVTTSDVPSARGVAFEAAGTLLVASASPGQIFRLTLSAAGIETAREVVGGPLSTPTGLALGADGRIYVTSEFGGTLQRMSADGTGVAMLGPSLSSPYFLDFGHGALCEDDVFVVFNGQMTRFANDTPGADVPWH